MKSKRFFYIELASRFLTILFGISLIILGLKLQAFAQGSTSSFPSAEFAIRELCSHMMGGLGALLMTASGVGAIVSGAFGNYKASYSLLIVGIAAFTVPTMLRFYFPRAADICISSSNTNNQSDPTAFPSENPGPLGP